MNRCPTCHAAVEKKPVCHRCGTDLARLADIVNRADQHLEEAARAYDAGDFQQMYTHARRARALHHTPRAETLLACAALALKQWNTALSIWARNA